MIVQDQSSLITWLSTPDAYGLTDGTVERFDTHSAVVFLAGAHAYKLKRAVRYDYLDFSTLERRRVACLDEVRLNQRTAPTLYLGVVPVTRASDRQWELNGTGEVVEWLVHMRRFDGEGLFDRLAARGALSLDLMSELGATVAALHDAAVARPDQGGAAGLAWVINGNAQGFANEGAGTLDAACARTVTTEARAALARVAARLDARRAAGFVRQCHGDLHLRNIVLLDGRPTLFDAVEFNDRIAAIDVLYDLAFLLMDLWRLGLKAHANRVLNAYLAPDADLKALALLPLFLSCRAAVRAKTSVTAAGLQTDGARSRELVAAADRYLSAALAFLNPPPPRLVAIGGRSGAGKSTLARGLAPEVGAAPGAVVLRSDALRKALAGVRETDPLPEESYSREVSARVYDALFIRAKAALQAGHAVVLDAVFLDVRERECAARVAADEGVTFSGLWLEAPLATLLDRVAARRRDASDATAAVVERQVSRAEGPMTWSRVDASGAGEDVLTRARETLNI